MKAEDGVEWSLVVHSAGPCNNNNGAKRARSGDSGNAKKANVIITPLYIYIYVYIPKSIVNLIIV